jgi:hypothetical protein
LGFIDLGIASRTCHRCTPSRPGGRNSTVILILAWVYQRRWITGSSPVMTIQKKFRIPYPRPPNPDYYHYRPVQ